MSGKPSVVSEGQLGLLYREQQDGLRDLKAYQWRVAYYVVGVQLLLTAANLFIFRSGLTSLILAVVSVIVFLALFYHLDSVQHRVARHREALAYLRRETGLSIEEARDYLRQQKDEPQTIARWKDEELTLVPLFGVQILALIIAIGAQILPG